MRLPFWVDYHYRLIKREKIRGMMLLGWLALAVTVCFVLVPQIGHYWELERLARTMDSRVAAAEKIRPAAAPAASPAVPQFRFSSGAGIEAVTDKCAAAGVAVVGYRPFKPAGDESVTEALELGLEGSFAGIKVILRWLGSGPVKADIRCLEIAAGEGKVSARILAVQRGASASCANGERPVFGRRADVFLDLTAAEPELAEEGMDPFREATAAAGEGDAIPSREVTTMVEEDDSVSGEVGPVAGKEDEDAYRDVDRDSGIDRGIGLDF